MDHATSSMPVCTDTQDLRDLIREGGDACADPEQESIPHSNDMKCRLLELAPELRNRIYEYAVIYDVPIDLVHCYGSTIRSAEARHLAKQPALTRTCKLIRLESLPMFYALNTFQGRLLDLRGSSRATWEWLRAISKHRKYLQNFTAEWYDSNGLMVLDSFILRKDVLRIVSAMGTLVKTNERFSWGVVRMEFGDNSVVNSDDLALER